MQILAAAFSLRFESFSLLKPTTLVCNLLFFFDVTVFQVPFISLIDLLCAVINLNYAEEGRKRENGMLFSEIFKICMHCLVSTLEQFFFRAKKVVNSANLVMWLALPQGFEEILQLMAIIFRKILCEVRACLILSAFSFLN